MFFKAITIKDKIGNDIVFRSAEESDAESLIKFLKITTAETPFLIREPNEVTLAMEQERAFIREKKEQERELLLIAEMNGRHLGNCSIASIGGFARYRHRCEVAIALYQEYCSLGIGRAMLETTLDVAKKVGYEQAELEVIAENQPAIALYKKLGFEIFGTFPHNMRYSDGTYADAYWMMKKLV